MGKKAAEKKHKISRRDFMGGAAAISLAALASGTTGRIFAAGSDRLRVGLIGCGERGTDATIQCAMASENVEIVAMGDLFQDRLDRSLAKLSRHRDDQTTVTEAGSFVGFDAYKKVLDSDVDLVILATPPGFRPEHFKAAIEAGKHVFMEKPVAVDPVGARSIIASSELAEQKGLAVVAGTQRRHQAHYLEIMKRIHDGAIGDILAGQCYWNGGSGGYTKRHPRLSSMAWQCRSWYFFTWLSGDHIVEQHVHNLDIINWALRSHPVKAMGIGGREVRSGDGNIYDHFAVEYEYPNGVRVLGTCRQIEGCSVRIGERVVGTKGWAYTDQSIGLIKGQNEFKYEGPSPDPYRVEHADMLASIREGKPLNEGKRIAESTLTAIMGRMSAYTGRELSWNWVINKSQLDLRPEKYEFGDLPVRPVAVPGKTKLI